MVCPEDVSSGLVLSIVPQPSSLPLLMSLSLNEAIGFFKEKFENFPILYIDEIPENELREIIEKRGDFFDFISEDKEKMNAISFNDLNIYLLKGFSPLPRTYCGYTRRENIIYIEHPFFLD